jgi:hypothetical protein
VYAFVDDSGDPGMKMTTGSTRYLVLAACIFREAEHVEAAAAAIHECRRGLGRGERWEFKHAKTSDDVKDAFFQATKRLTYDVRAIVIDKQRLHSEPLMTRAGYLQNYAIMQIFTHTLDTVTNAKLVIDGNATRALQLKSATYFRRQVNERAPGTLRKVDYDDSARNPLIQLADMTAGAIRRHYEHPEKASKLHFAMINGRARAPRGSMWDFTADK